MEFRYIYLCETRSINFEKDGNLTVLDLRKIIEKEIQLENFDILDLGRIVHDCEILFEMKRNTFTIYKSRFK